ncbi:hypothetical protein KL86CLO1_12137 [uncultured Eubacteriales bacterium]|uniref:Uncharacterized protein n=1 Tax=uncultured Eubacteriales bacterium TaxID=172733 RepID=A0A212K3G6_9FIRM|nr:hypothetical protein KL86CLO1_12137 [uncultured Eubacteriales bacterium]
MFGQSEIINLGETRDINDLRQSASDISIKI